LEKVRNGRRRPRAAKAAAGPPPAFVPLSRLLSTVAAPPDPAHGPPCHLCSALCCKYFALEIDKPVTPSDHDEIRWYLLHQNAVVWVQEGGWYLEVRNVCRHLQPDGSCGIYDTRPQICRDYGLPEKEGPCEYFTQDVSYDLFFETAEAFESWSRAELAKREQRLARRRARRERSRAADPVASRASGG